MVRRDKKETTKKQTKQIMADEAFVTFDQFNATQLAGKAPEGKQFTNGKGETIKFASILKKSQDRLEKTLIEELNDLNHIAKAYLNECEKILRRF